MYIEFIRNRLDSRNRTEHMNTRNIIEAKKYNKNLERKELFDKYDEHKR